MDHPDPGSSMDVEEDGYSSISGETLQKAMKELKEDPATRGNIVKELRERILVEESELRVSLPSTLM